MGQRRTGHREAPRIGVPTRSRSAHGWMAAWAWRGLPQKQPKTLAAPCRYRRRIAVAFVAPRVAPSRLRRTARGRNPFVCTAFAMGREGFEPSTLGLRDTLGRLGLSRFVWVCRRIRISYALGSRVISAPLAGTSLAPSRLLRPGGPRERRRDALDGAGSPRLVLVREPDQLGVERTHTQLALGVRFVELAEPNRHVAACQSRRRPPACRVCGPAPGRVGAPGAARAGPRSPAALVFDRFELWGRRGRTE